MALVAVSVEALVGGSVEALAVALDAESVEASVDGSVDGTVDGSVESLAVASAAALGG